MSEAEAMTDVVADTAPVTPAPVDDRRSKVLAEYRKTLLAHKEIDNKVRQSELPSCMRLVAS